MRKIIITILKRLLKSTEVDLTRENLNIINGVRKEENLGKDYYMLVNNLLDNKMLKKEMEDIVFEHSQAILKSEPINGWINKEKSDYLSRGTINGIALLQERLDRNNIILQELLDRENFES